MEPERTLPVDDRLFRWLAVQIARTPNGSLQFDIRDGQLTAIFIMGSRTIRAPEELQEPNQPPCP